MWSERELKGIGSADELRIAPRKRDGSLRRPIPIWVVRVDDDLYVRSFRGRQGAWFGVARHSGQGHINAGGVDKEVEFVEESDPPVLDRVDRAYEEKYGRYSRTYVDPMVGSDARQATLRLQSR